MRHSAHGVSPGQARLAGVAAFDAVSGCAIAAGRTRRGHHRVDGGLRNRPLGRAHRAGVIGDRSGRARSLAGPLWSRPPVSRHSMKR